MVVNSFPVGSSIIIHWLTTEDFTHQQGTSCREKIKCTTKKYDEIPLFKVISGLGATLWKRELLR